MYATLLNIYVNFKPLCLERWIIAKVEILPNMHLSAFIRPLGRIRRMSERIKWVLCTAAIVATSCTQHVSGAGAGNFRNGAMSGSSENGAEPWAGNSAAPLTCSVLCIGVNFLRRRFSTKTILLLHRNTECSALSTDKQNDRALQRQLAG